MYKARPSEIKYKVGLKLASAFLNSLFIFPIEVTRFMKEVNFNFSEKQIAKSRADAK